MLCEFQVKRKIVRKVDKDATRTVLEYQNCDNVAHLYVIKGKLSQTVAKLCAKHLKHMQERTHFEITLSAQQYTESLL